MQWERIFGTGNPVYVIDREAQIAREVVNPEPLVLHVLAQVRNQVPGSQIAILYQP